MNSTHPSSFRFDLSPRRVAVAVALAIGCLGAAACHADDAENPPTESRNADLAAMQGTLVEIIPANPIDQGQLKAIATYLEQKSNAARAKVMVREEEGGAQHLEIELWADDALDQSVYADLESAFPELAGATITHAVVAGPPADEPGMPSVDVEANDNLSAEELKAKVEADLRAQGVEGDIHVDVVDEDGERRVEVRVEKTEDKPSDG